MPSIPSGGDEGYRIHLGCSMRATPLPAVSAADLQTFPFFISNFPHVATFLWVGVE